MLFIAKVNSALVQFIHFVISGVRHVVCVCACVPAPRPLKTVK